jgi:Ca-activated chloride channel family protein
MQKALRHVLSFPRRTGRMRLVVFLTDGAVGNEHSLMRMLDESLDEARIFAFAIGSAPNEYLVRKMAEIGRGQARFIRSHEDIGEVMADFFRTLESPVLTDVRLSWEGKGGVRPEGIRYYPDPPPDIYVDRPLQVVMQYPTGFSGRLVARGILDGEEVEYAFPLEPKEGQRHRAIESLYGRALIGDLMYRWIHGTPQEKTHLKEKIVEEALRYQLVSKFTSRVAVEEKIERRPEGTLVSVPVRVPLPRGWDPGAFHPTATGDPALLAAGLLLLLSGGGIALGRRRAALEKRHVS